MKHKRSKFSGTIKYISVSPHGDPEGLVFDDGTFVKTPPHSLLNGELIKVGASVEGEGELIGGESAQVFHHAKVVIGGRRVADDSIDKEKKEALKEQHKKDIKARDEAPLVKANIRGKAVAFGVKPKGEIDRIIMADGTSVHVPKDIEISKDDFSVGDMLDVRGESRSFGDLRFVKADKVQRANA